MSTANTTDSAIDRYLAGLEGSELLVPISWEQWLGIDAPHPSCAVTRQEVTARYARNGYEWDMHGSLFLPERERDSGFGIVMFHGGAGSENIFDKTPDGRPGLGRVLASQGIRALALTYPGHWSGNPGGMWTIPVPERQPRYLLDRNLPEAEIIDRNLKCDFNVILQGAAQLTDTHLAGRKILAFGHSTGGPMAAHLHRFVKKVEIIGIVGFGSGGPDGWRRIWRLETGAEELPRVRLRGSGRPLPLGWCGGLYRMGAAHPLADEDGPVRQSASRQCRDIPRLCRAHRSRAQRI